MKQFLVEFRAEYYCQGFEYGWFTKLVTANTFEEACDIIKETKTNEWEYQTPEYFKNKTLN
jgi:hypothetical protein